MPLHHLPSENQTVRSIVVALIVLAAGCSLAWSAEPPAAADQNIAADHPAKMKAGLELFQKEVRQILAGRCVKCHGGQKTESEFDLNSRDGLIKGGAGGPAVVIGKPDESRLIELIEHRDEPKMPEDGAKLPDRQIAAIAKWIELGAPYDKILVEKETAPDAWVGKRVDPSARDFWSFQPLQVSAAPALANDDWSTSEIDRFVLAKLRQQNMTPNPRADKRVLLRRIYFDLIGMPPTAEEVERFMNDRDPRAYERLVERLMDSPHYGERWGRHWLDVARFAESHGFEQDYDRPHAYHFRDFVIRALNADMPFDQFVRWQLAGDEIAPDNPQAMMATGFLGAGVFPTQLTEKEFESSRYDELDDMVATMGTAMLGLTIGCARCHDHKFDPIPSADYYRVLSTFTTAIRSELNLDLQPDVYREALGKWEHEHQPLAEALREFERNELPRRFEAWLKQLQLSAREGQSERPTWVIVQPQETQSQAGAVFTPQADGSLLVTGENGDVEKYTFVVPTLLTGITGLRLEALAHESMVKGGPGRAGNGNIGLSNLSVTVQPLDGKGDAVAVKLVNPRATFQQNSGNLSIAAAVDSDPKSGWAVDPEFGKDHAAAFDFAEPVGFADGTKFAITLEFNVNAKHNIGRPRLAIGTSGPGAALGAAAQKQELVEVLDVLRRNGGQLTTLQRDLMLGWYRSTDAEWQKLRRPVDEHLRVRPQPQLTPVMVVTEGQKPIKHHADDRGFPHFYKETYFLKRGDPAQRFGVAGSGFLQVLMNVPGQQGPGAAEYWKAEPPPGSGVSFRRTALAHWITDPEHGAGQLLARVIVNRLWQHHMGRGIVSTPNDFGAQGQRPTHPELLDWLANQLIQSGWRLKPIHQLIATSSVYTQSSADDEADEGIDPDNRWYWRRAPRRLEAEIIRDSMLAATGSLDPTMYGPGTLDDAQRRRSIYFMVKRSKLIPAMQIFDAPEPLVSIGQRPSTTIAPQALHFMNNPQVRSYAQQFARRIALGTTPDTDPAVWIRKGYLMALSRPPSDDEQQDGAAFLAAQRQQYRNSGQGDDNTLALTDFCQVLLSLNEFIYVE